ncbi:hypothetical protein LOTGIDRAFT_162008 [Lottia gigantea]|uniref:Uncharacterized protein n=1 Tax=Lottia gigantea TaxID=225164 RepID=V4A8D5_LOTGI|nr:hypothetical protein LOTGIDRAFT_162008 [Lottia gigantea]ESO92982.1 hypothetical protein LOTGIDRAFT_162008 [Lottia gigantea]
MVLKLLDKNVNAQTPKTYFGSDNQNSLGSLPGFPWAKYPGDKHLPGHNYTGPDTSLIDVNISYHEEYLNHRRQWGILPNSVTNIRGFKIVDTDFENRTSAEEQAFWKRIKYVTYIYRFY